MVNHPARGIPVGAGVRLPDGRLAKRVNQRATPRGMVAVCLPPDEVKFLVPRRGVRYIARTYAAALEWEAAEAAARVQSIRERNQP